MRILVILDRPDTASLTLRTAGALADRFGCRDIRLLHPALLDDPDFRSSDEGIASPAERARFAHEVSARADALREAARGWIEAAGRAGTAQWIEIAGDIRKIVAREASVADMTVLSRPRPGDPDYVDQAFAGALYDAQAAVAIAPFHRRDGIGARPVIAWRPSAALDRAVAAALPLLAKAERVTFVIGEGRAGAEPTPKLAGELGRKGVAVSLDRFVIAAGDVGEQIRQHALAAGGDLLIMGAYTHPHFVEWLFGGPTRDILAHGTLPILTHR